MSENDCLDYFQTVATITWIPHIQHKGYLSASDSTSCLSLTYCVSLPSLLLYFQIQLKLKPWLTILSINQITVDLIKMPLVSFFRSNKSQTQAGTTDSSMIQIPLLNTNILKSRQTLITFPRLVTLHTHIGWGCYHFLMLMLEVSFVYGSLFWCISCHALDSTIWILCLSWPPFATD